MPWSETVEFSYNYAVLGNPFKKRVVVFFLGGGGGGGGGGGRCSDGAVMRPLASHQCGPVSIPSLGVICGLSLLVLYSALRGFSPGTPVFPLFKNQHLT